LLYSAYLPALERVQRGIPAAASTLVLVVGAAIAFVVAAMLSDEMFLPAGKEVWTNILLLAFASTVIAFSFLIAGLAILGPVRTAIIATVEPFFTALLGVVVLGNVFQRSTITGGVLIAAAVVTIEWSSGKGEISSRLQGAGDARSR
jgi:drug/metabolite transporter (DMT)-like permease